MEPEGMRMGWTVKVMRKRATTRTYRSDWMAGRVPTG